MPSFSSITTNKMSPLHLQMEGLTIGGKKKKTTLMIYHVETYMGNNVPPKDDIYL